MGDYVETDILPCIKVGMNGIWLNRKDKGLAFPGVKMIRSLTELGSVLPRWYRLDRP